MEVKTLHCGQRCPYGDSYYEFQIVTDKKLSYKECIELTNHKNRFGYPWMSYTDWSNTPKDMAQYFGGYCDVIANSEGYKVVYCEPYDD